MSLDRIDKAVCFPSEERRVSFSLPREKKKSDRSEMSDRARGRENDILEMDEEQEESSRNNSVDSGVSSFAIKHKKKWKIKLPWKNNKKPRTLSQPVIRSPLREEEMFEYRKSKSFDQSISDDDENEEKGNDEEAIKAKQELRLRSFSWYGDSHFADPLEDENKSKSSTNITESINVEVTEEASSPSRDSALKGSKTKSQSYQHFSSIDSSSDDDLKFTTRKKKQGKSKKKSKYSEKNSYWNTVSQSQPDLVETDETFRERDKMKLGRQFSESEFVENLNFIEDDEPAEDVKSSIVEPPIKKSNSLPSIFFKKKKKKEISSSSKKRDTRIKSYSEETSHKTKEDSVNEHPETPEVSKNVLKAESVQSLSPRSSPITQTAKDQSHKPLVHSQKPLEHTKKILEHPQRSKDQNHTIMDHPENSDKPQKILDQSQKTLDQPRKPKRSKKSSSKHHHRHRHHHKHPHSPPQAYDEKAQTSLPTEEPIKDESKTKLERSKSPPSEANFKENKISDSEQKKVSKHKKEDLNIIPVTPLPEYNQVYRESARYDVSTIVKTPNLSDSHYRKSKGVSNFSNTFPKASELRARRRSYEEMVNLLEEEMFENQNWSDDDSSDTDGDQVDLSFNKLLDKGNAKGMHTKPNFMLMTNYDSDVSLSEIELVFEPKIPLKKPDSSIPAQNTEGKKSPNLKRPPGAPPPPPKSSDTYREGDNLFNNSVYNSSSQSRPLAKSKDKSKKKKLRKTMKIQHALSSSSSSLEDIVEHIYANDEKDSNSKDIRNSKFISKELKKSINTTQTFRRTSSDSDTPPSFSPPPVPDAALENTNEKLGFSSLNFVNPQPNDSSTDIQPAFKNSKTPQQKDSSLLSSFTSKNIDTSQQLKNSSLYSLTAFKRHETSPQNCSSVRSFPAPTNLGASRQKDGSLNSGTASSNLETSQLENISLHTYPTYKNPEASQYKDSSFQSWSSTKNLDTSQKKDFSSHTLQSFNNIETSQQKDSLLHSWSSSKNLGTPQHKNISLYSGSVSKNLEPSQQSSSSLGSWATSINLEPSQQKESSLHILQPPKNLETSKQKGSTSNSSSASEIAETSKHKNNSLHSCAVAKNTEISQQKEDSLQVISNEAKVSSATQIARNLFTQREQNRIMTAHDDKYLMSLPIKNIQSATLRNIPPPPPPAPTDDEPVFATPVLSASSYNVRSIQPKYDYFSRSRPSEKLSSATVSSSSPSDLNSHKLSESKMNFDGTSFGAKLVSEDERKLKSGRSASQGYFSTTQASSNSDEEYVRTKNILESFSKKQEAFETQEKENILSISNATTQISSPTLHTNTFDRESSQQKSNSSLSTSNQKFYRNENFPACKSNFVPYSNLNASANYNVSHSKDENNMSREHDTSWGYSETSASSLATNYYSPRSSNVEYSGISYSENSSLNSFSGSPISPDSNARLKEKETYSGISLSYQPEKGSNDIFTANKDVQKMHTHENTSTDERAKQDDEVVKEKFIASYPNISASKTQNPILTSAKSCLENSSVFSSSQPLQSDLLNSKKQVVTFHLPSAQNTHHEQKTPSDLTITYTSLPEEERIYQNVTQIRRENEHACHSLPPRVQTESRLEYDKFLSSQEDSKSNLRDLMQEENESTINQSQTKSNFESLPPVRRENKPMYYNMSSHRTESNPIFHDLPPFQKDNSCIIRHDMLSEIQENKYVYHGPSPYQNNSKPESHSSVQIPHRTKATYDLPSVQSEIGYSSARVNRDTKTVYHDSFPDQIGNKPVLHVLSATEVESKTNLLRSSQMSQESSSTYFDVSQTQEDRSSFQSVAPSQTQEDRSSFQSVAPVPRENKRFHHSPPKEVVECFDKSRSEETLKSSSLVQRQMLSMKQEAARMPYLGGSPSNYDLSSAYYKEKVDVFPEPKTNKSSNESQPIRTSIGYIKASTPIPYGKQRQPLKSILRNANKPQESHQELGQTHTGDRQREILEARPTSSKTTVTMASADVITASTYNTTIERVKILDDSSSSEDETPPSPPRYPPPPPRPYSSLQQEFFGELLQPQEKVGAPRFSQPSYLSSQQSNYIPTIIEVSAHSEEPNSIYQKKVHVIERKILPSGCRQFWTNPAVQEASVLEEQERIHSYTKLIYKEGREVWPKVKDYASSKRSNNLLGFHGHRRGSNSVLSDEETEEDLSSSACSDSGEEDDDVMRSYHIGPPPTGISEAGLATIAEDIEEDSGGESSGNWMFSADNTDTDSVIHVPQPPFERGVATSFSLVGEADNYHSSSEETLIGSEDEIVKVNSENWNRPDYKKTKEMSHDKDNESNKLTLEEGKDAINSLESRPMEGDVPDAFVSKCSEDLFGLSSLETCENVSVCSEFEEDDPALKMKGNEYDANEDHVQVVFNTSATSRPFADGTSAVNGNSLLSELKNQNEKESKCLPFEEGKENVRAEITEESVRTSKENGAVENNSVIHDEEDKKRSQKIASLEVEVEATSLSYELSPSKNLSTNNPNEVQFPPETSHDYLCQRDPNNPTALVQPVLLSSPSTSVEVSRNLDSNMPQLLGVKGESPLRGSCTSSFGNKTKQKRILRPHNRLRSRDALRHSKSSDGDTDDTDGDCEEESQFVKSASSRRDDKKVLVKTSQQPAGYAELNERAESREGSETSKDVLFVGKSSEVPLSTDPRDPCQQSASATSTTRSVETLSEDSGLGDQNFRLTPLSPLASISESLGASTKEGAVPPPDAIQNRLVRPFSLGDLRYYSSESDSDTDEVRMRAFSDLKASLGRNNEQNKFSSPSRDPYFYLQNKTAQFGDRKTSNNFEQNMRGQSENRIINRLNNVSNKPRRHQSMYEPNTLNEHLGTWERPPRAQGSHVIEMRNRNTPRPKPLSIDMAEEFLSQEGLNSPTNKYNNPYVQSSIKSEEITVTTPSMGVVQNLPGYRVAVGSEVGGAKFPPPCGNIQEEKCISNSSSASELMDVDAWLSARAKRHTVLPSPPRYSCEPQLRSSPEKSNVESCSPPVDALYPTSHSSAMSDSVRSGGPLATHGQSHLGALTAPKEPPRGGITLPEHMLDTKEGMNRVRTKTYGPHGEVEVYLAKTPDQVHLAGVGSASTLINPGVETSIQLRQGGSRGVTFSPSVKEVNWRESYIEPDDSDYLFTQLEEKEVKKVKVISCDSPKVLKCQPSVTSLNSSGETKQEKVSNNILPDPRLNNQFSTFKPNNEVDRAMKEVSENKVSLTSFKPNISLNEDSENKVISTSFKANTSLNEQSENRVNLTSFRPNTSPNEHPSPATSLVKSPNAASPSSPRTSTPIWQRLKLVKIGSPKGPRPKVPPKPPSLSPRSSDSESNKPSSPSSPESGVSSPSSPDFKFKKIPSSPRFFSWGSKREKKNNSEQPVSPITPNSSPPPVVTSSPPPSSVSSAHNLPSPQVNNVAKETQVDPSVITTTITTTTTTANPLKSEKENQREVFRSLVQSNNKTNATVNEGVKHTRTEPHKLTSTHNGTSVSKDGMNGVVNSVDDFYKIRESILKSSSVSKPESPKSDEVNGTQNVIISNAPSRSLGFEEPAEETSTVLTAEGRPPLPPTQPSRSNLPMVNKVRLINARRQYMTQGRTLSAQDPKNDNSEIPTKNGAPSIEPRCFIPPPAMADPPPPPAVAARRGKSASERLKERFERFSKATRAERERLARSTPDLSQMEASVRRHTPRIDCCVQNGEASSSLSGSDGTAPGLSSSARGNPVTREGVRSSSTRGSVASPISAEFDRISQRTRTRSVGLLETDLDTGASREFLTPQETNLDDLYQDLQTFLDTLPQVPYLPTSKERTRAKSLLQLDAAADAPQTMENNLTTSRTEDSRAKSMEFLLDDENRAAAKAPENELMKEGERKVSEAELRVRRSLQRLDVPDWMKSGTPQQGFLLRRRDYTTGTTSAGGWSGFSSKTGSMTSLGSSRANTPTKVVIPTRASTRSYGGITSPSSTASISPSPSERVDRGTLFPYPLSRWSTSRINSGTTTPTGSLTSQRTASFSRQPYLGWRSNTSLTSLGGSQSSLAGNAYLSPAERLALTLLQSKQEQSSTEKESKDSSRETTSTAQETSKIASNAESQKVSTDTSQVAASIKEVTSAIVHYCKETASPKPSPHASPSASHRDTSPRRLVWVESSFVGSRPITSPQTPTTATGPLTPPAVNGHQEELVETRPPQPPEENSLLNSFSSAGSNNIRDGSRESTAASTNDSTTVLPDCSRADSGNSLDYNDQLGIERRQNTSRNGRSSLSENSSRHSIADTINSAISSRGIDSLNSRNSAGSSISRQSSGSRHSSSGRGGRSSREELPDSRGSCEDIVGEGSDGPKDQIQSKNFLSLTDDSTLTASCHSSFGTFQIEDDSIPLTFDAQQNDRENRFHLEGIKSIGAESSAESSTSRRFSEGANPWEQNPLFLERKPRILENTWETDEEEQGYGFNFSSYSKETPLLQDESTSEDVGTESTTLEDVLDSLLALPSASRSPSPSSGPHPLSMVRPHTHSGFLSPEDKPTSNELKCDPPSSNIPSSYSDLGTHTEDTRYSYLRNHDFGTDPKTENYHKSFNYSSSTFVPSKSPVLHSRSSVLDTKSRDNLTLEGEKSSVTFYLGKNEDNITNRCTKVGFVNQSFTSTPEKENTFPIDHFERRLFASSVNRDSSFISTLENSDRTFRTSQPMTTFSQSSPFTQVEKEGNTNLTNQLGLNSSCRTTEKVVRRVSVESGMPEQKNSSTSSVIKEETDPVVKEVRVTFHLPPKHMNIPPDSSSENGNGTENLRVEIEDEDDVPSSSDTSGLLVHCRNSLCNNSDTVEEAKANYKTCHNCSVFYCSRTCRRVHWEKHKKLCEKIKASTVARQVIEKVRDNPAVSEAMSAVAKRGILAIGRGAVKIFFADTAAAETFVGNGGIPDAHYQPVQNIMPQEMGSETYKRLIELCRNYNPQIKFILYVSICTFSETPTGSSLKCRRETTAKCAKLKLSDTCYKGNTNSSKVQPEHHVITRDLNEPDTLLLAAFPGSNYGLPPRQAREVAFSNIVRELQDRGVNLRHHHADVYRKLSHYVDVGDSFPPITIYPKDARRRNSFMCIIMPEADPARLRRIGTNSSKVKTIDISRPHPPVT